MGKIQTKGRTVVTTIHLPRVLLHRIDQLVEEGLFRNRSEFIRFAVTAYLHELEKMRREKKEQPVVAIR